jgi:hypothetical protein
MTATLFPGAKPRTQRDADHAGAPDQEPPAIEGPAELALRRRPREAPRRSGSRTPKGHGRWRHPARVGPCRPH